MSLSLLLALTLGAAPAGYDPVSESAGVAVYRRRDSPLIELYAEGEIDAPPAQVRAVLLDYEHHPAYFQRMAEVRLLRRGEGTLLVYQRVRMPVIADRDMVLEVRYGQDGDELWTRFRALGAAAGGALGAPASPRGVVRVTDHEGGWRLRPLDGGRRTRASYRVRMDLAGSVPRWIARGNAGGDMAGLFEAVRRQARRPR